ncbi:hypothetical protein NP233_g4753 [Leucocoprinus birnbaumii]|uniref:Protein F37C4.5 n=1 Tax=Leucocoprinus birnbaumii TaxID=56174 RepID=A0AAD5VWU0_9AGAR|nr:hypothetical protein NP233_g4753 [Leucocoprinus birnbaumii]
MHRIRVLATEHPIDSIILSNTGKAEITRAFKIDLQEGQTKVTFSMLSSSLDPHSVRISVPGFPKAKHRAYLSKVTCSRVSGSDDPLNKTVHALKAQKKLLQHEGKVLHTQAEVMVKYANTLDGRYAGPEAMNTFLGAFLEHGKENMQKLADIDAKLEEIDQQICAEKKNYTARGSSNSEVIAVIKSEEAANVELQLAYIVNGPVWSPAYELHIESDEHGRPSSTVHLHYCVHITQTTGEDWDDTRLILSTGALHDVARRSPSNKPVQMNISSSASRKSCQSPPAPRRAPPPPPARVIPTLAHPACVERLDRSTNSLDTEEEAPGPVFPGELRTGVLAPLGSAPAIALKHTIPERTPSQTSVSESAAALSYAIAGKISVPADAGNHVVTIANLAFPVEYKYVSVPRLDPRVYLECFLQNNSEFRLLSGPISVIINGRYVSKTDIPDVPRNNSLTIPLGDDPSILISYTRRSQTKKEGAGSFAEVMNVTTYTNTISVTNEHSFAVEQVVIRDALPTTPHSRVQVLLKSPQELIEAKEGVLVNVDTGKLENVNKMEEEEEDKDFEVIGEAKVGEGLKVKWTKEKEGLHEYQCRLNANAEAKLEMVYETRVPNDLLCSF